MKQLVNSYIQKLVQTKWDVAVHGRDLYLVKPTLGPPKKFQHLTRAGEVVITRLRIGHTKATKSHILSRGPPTSCHHCGQTLTIDHMLLECALLQECRDEYYTVDSLNALFETVPETCIVEFLREAGFFYLIWYNLLTSASPQTCTMWPDIEWLFREWKQLWDTFTCVGRLICPEGCVLSLNKFNPIQSNLFRRATPSKLWLHSTKGCCPGTQLGVTKGTGGVTVCTVNWKRKYQIPVHLKINVQLSGTGNSSHNWDVNASVLCWGKVVAESVSHGD